MCIYAPNMKFLCLILCQGEMCTDANTDAKTEANAGRRHTMDKA